MKEKKRVLSVLMSILMTILWVFPAFASDKTISSVTLRISSKLEAGDTLPPISYTNDGDTGVGDGDICISNASTKYSIVDAEWITSKTREMKVGDTPEMKVTLSPTHDGDVDYAFKGTYRSSNVSIRSGTFISASKKDGNLVVRLKVHAIGGSFAPPEDAYWRDNAKGTARWEEPETGGTGRYEVVLRRGSERVHTTETTARTYNFYPYMTKAGTYTFRVRTIAKTSAQSDNGKNSEWIDSDEIYIAKEDVSDGRGQDTSDSTSKGPSGNTGPTGNIKTGWQKENNSWYYYYPDGSYKKNGWEAVNGKWYLFQSDGRMLSGWQNLNNQTYYLGEDGAMWIGWIQWGQRWYYMNPTPDAYQGCMLKDRWLTVNGKTYYFDNTGAMVEGWKQIGEHMYYFYPGEGNMAVNTNIGEFYVNEQGIWVH